VNCAYADNQPEYSLLPVSSVNGIHEEFSAKVVLPSFLDPSLREARGESTWKTEKRAKKDAAFQAYLALYRAGLVNDNLMPAHKEKYVVDDDDDGQSTSTQMHANLVQGSECLNPWADIVELRRCHEPLVPTRICIESRPLGMNVPQMVLLLPIYLPVDLSFDLFWNDQITLKVRLSRDDAVAYMDVDDIAEFSSQLVSSAFHSNVPSGGHDLITLFWPVTAPSDNVKHWIRSIKGNFAAAEIARESYVGDLQNLGLASHTEAYARPFTIEKILDTRRAEDRSRDAEDDTLNSSLEEVYLQGATLPKRTDFLHPIPHDAKAPMHHTAKQCVPISSSSISRFPAIYSRFALFIPSIAHKIGVFLLAEKLCKTILADVRFEDLHLVATAISASSARESTDYQRLEFLGDSLLKFMTSIHLTAAHPVWHEGLLSSSKDKIVSNNRLSRAALDMGLDKYILTKAFTGRKWRPTYISDFSEPGELKTRELSSKVLADVVEALLGASYMDGGIERLLNCLRIFLPEVKWGRIDEQIDALNQAASSSAEVAGLPKLLQVEDMIGYQFTKRSLLLEASTHPCSKDHGVSYQRLEFLGDSVLDHIVVQELFKAPRDLSHQEMHLIRSTLVNADFLAYLCMSLYTTEEREEPEVPGQAHVSMVPTVRKLYLWHFMRHSASWEIVNAQQQAFQRYERCGDKIREALENSSAYPWALLAQIEAAKFFSDLIESILGAIFVDTHGDLDTCRHFLHHIGLLPYLQRIHRDHIDLLHPRNRLQHAAGSDKVEFHTTADKVVSESEGSTVSWTCAIRVNGEDIAELKDGLNKIEVVTRTCSLAATILEMQAAECMEVDDAVVEHLDNLIAAEDSDGS
jgi:dsRNA-specific ribonuclease